MPTDPAPSRAEFAQRVIREMRAAGLEGEVTYDEIAGTLTHAERGPFDLEQAYRQLASPGGRPDNPEMLKRLVRFYVRPPAIPQTWDEAKKRVLPWILPMSRQVERAFQQEIGLEKDGQPYAALTEHVTAEVGIPLEDGTAEASAGILSKWGIDFEEALNQATTNLARRGTPTWGVSPDYPGVFRSPWDDGFDASRILLPSALRQMPVKGDPILILHAPTCVLAAGSEDPDALFQLGRCAKKQWELNHGSHITRPLRRQDGKFAHWMPPRNHAAHPMLRLMEALAEKKDYDALVSVTRARFEQKDITAATPPVQIVQSPLGDTRTVTIWSDRTATALPQADGIVFKRGGEFLGAAEFSDVKRVLGAELEPLSVYPQRWLARTFPAQWQLGQMGLVPWRHRET